MTDMNTACAIISRNPLGHNLFQPSITSRKVAPKWHISKLAVPSIATTAVIDHRHRFGISP